MVFSSLVFIFGFLPLVLLAYFAAPARYRNAVLLLASYLFYAWGAPRFLFVLLGSSAADWYLSRGIAAQGGSRTGRARCLLVAGLALNLGVLLYAKYANFFVGELNRVLEAAGFTPAPWSYVALPIGISFFTFQKLSYLLDVYRGTAAPARGLGSYLLYVALFPQLIAGPIVRYHDIAAQLHRRRASADRIASGAVRFCAGLGRKVLVANAMGRVADELFGLEPAALGMGAAWLGALCYAFQIYFDFSGYSDMAIGLARMFGFELLENFDRPYVSRSFTEFWRRWHISLSNWMRDYLYIPLGGNRRGAARTVLNLWIVFLLSGLWHGAAWTFVIWGAYHGLFLSLERLAGAKRLARIPPPLATAGTFALLLVGWVFFRAETLPHALQYLSQMFIPGRSAAATVTWRSALDPHAATVLAAAALISFAPALTRPYERVRQALLPVRPAPAAFCYAAALAMMLLSASALATGGFNPFIYFRF